MCKASFKGHQIHLDHIDPVINLKTGWVDWTQFIERLFCDVDGFQVLCTNCHDAKTKIEDSMRVHFSNEKKKKK